MSPRASTDTECQVDAGAERSSGGVADGNDAVQPPRPSASQVIVTWRGVPALTTVDFIGHGANGHKPSMPPSMV